MQVKHNELVREALNGPLMAGPVSALSISTLHPPAIYPHPLQASSVRAALLVQEEELKRHFDAVTGMMEGEEEEGKEGEEQED